ncbi:mechanosensitive ion channel family protein [Desulfovibrio sp. JC010]|uniref:mechanosensitive ion channel family protein n=1 Tax=Desulfovibrio sp. JC010 TaxID=2593641 RepID=UPI00193F34EB|nr:mechanosensitive ion channel family protein [Desulfovibrio sp. JC010]
MDNATQQASEVNAPTLFDWFERIQEMGLDVWQNGIPGISLINIGQAVGVFLFFIILRRFLTKFTMNRLKNMLEKHETQGGASVLKALAEPVRFIPVVLGLFFADQCLDLPLPVETFTNTVVKALILFVIFWSAFNLVSVATKIFRKLEKVLTPSLVDWLIKLVKFLVILMGVASILELFGIDIGPILTGLGLFSVAVALGAKDLFQNIIAGISIIAESRFDVGDWITVDGKVDGTVEFIGFRSTRIRRFDKAPVYVPNSALSDNCLINFSKMTHRRILWNIGVEYRTSTEQLKLIQERVMEYILGSDDFAHPPEVSTFMRVVQFGDSSIDFQLYAFTKTTDWLAWLKIREDLAYRIKDIVEVEAGTGFAFPSQSIYVETVPGVAAENFVVPEKK